MEYIFRSTINKCLHKMTNATAVSAAPGIDFDWLNLSTIICGSAVVRIESNRLSDV